MPELPEVETQVRDLQVLKGEQILDITTSVKKLFQPDFVVFCEKIKGCKIIAIERRAKYIIFTLEALQTPIKKKEFKLVVHFRMTGHFLLRKKNDLADSFARVIFSLTHSKELRYEDIRKFGTFQLCDIENYEKECGLDKLGPEPLDFKFTSVVLQNILAKKRGKLKAVLMDQSVVAGIGNIYADEICFTTGLHPAFPVEKLTFAQIKKLHQAIIFELKKGIKNRGTSIGEYVDTKNQAGENQNSLQVYGRYGKSCKKCGTILSKMKISQRTTVFCKQCQKNE